MAFFTILYNALTSLISTDDRSVKIAVKYLQLADGPRIVISIHDTGQSMPNENLEHMYEPLFVPDDDQNIRLGLATVKEIIEDHGGRLDIKACSPMGTSVDIQIPLP
jgi:nitrogen fixation/metabolism regulation signal transduction histidine kinase